MVEVEARYAFLVHEPAEGTAQEYAFRMRSGDYAWAGIFRSRWERPVGGQVFRWTGNAAQPWEVITARTPGVQVEVQMDASDVTTTTRLLWAQVVDPSFTMTTDSPVWRSFDDDATAAFWPTYDVDGGIERYEFHARVTVAGAKAIQCAETYRLETSSRRSSVERLRVLPGWTEVPTDEFGFASRDDLAVGFRVVNPADYPIYARIVQKPITPGQILVALPPPEQAPRHRSDPGLLRVFSRASRRSSFR